MAAFHARFKKSATADQDAAMDPEAQQAAMIKKKFDTFHTRYQKSPPSSEASPPQSTSKSSKADAVDTVPLIDKQTPGPSPCNTSQAAQHPPGAPPSEPLLRHESISQSSKESRSSKVTKPDKADGEAIKAQFAAIHSRYQNGPSHPDASSYRQSSNPTSSSRRSANVVGVHQSGPAPPSNLNRAPMFTTADVKTGERHHRPRPPEPAQSNNGSDDKAKNRHSSMFTRSKPPKPAKSSEHLISPPKEENEKVPAQDITWPNSVVSASKSRRDIAIRPTSPYEPTPLFQAYPQAVKHTTLPVPILSADSILQYRKNTKVNADNGLEENRATKGGKDGRLLQALHEETDGDHWTRHVYILVTSGYLLQYSEEGAHDRLPERILQLGKGSAAFASDALPGKYYVLQISADAEVDGPVKHKTSTKKVFQKMGFRSESAKRAVSNLLMVFGTPEEMEAWIMAVRKEIENMGGKPYRRDDQPEVDTGEESNGFKGGQLSRYNNTTIPLQRCESLDTKPDANKNRNQMSTSRNRSHSRQGCDTDPSAGVEEGDRVQKGMGRRDASRLRKRRSRYDEMKAGKDNENMLERLGDGVANQRSSSNGSKVATTCQQQNIELPKLKFSEIVWGKKEQEATSAQEGESCFTSATTTPNHPNISPPDHLSAESSIHSRKASAISTASSTIARSRSSRSGATSNPDDDRWKSTPNLSKRYTVGDMRSRTASSARSSLLAASPKTHTSASRLASTFVNSRSAASHTRDPATSSLPSVTMPPKRHSSLAHFHGVLPTTTPLLLLPSLADKLPTPLPPPTGALPALPRSKSVMALNRRSWYAGGDWEGVRRESIPEVETRVAGEISHSNGGTTAAEKAKDVGMSDDRTQQRPSEPAQKVQLVTDEILEGDKRSGRKSKLKRKEKAPSQLLQRHTLPLAEKGDSLQQQHDHHHHYEAIVQSPEKLSTDDSQQPTRQQAHAQSPSRMVLPTFTSPQQPQPQSIPQHQPVPQHRHHSPSPPSRAPQPPPPLRRASTLMQLRSFMAAAEAENHHQQQQQQQPPTHKHEYRSKPEPEGEPAPPAEEPKSERKSERTLRRSSSAWFLRSTRNRFKG